MIGLHCLMMAVYIHGNGGIHCLYVLRRVVILVCVPSSKTPLLSSKTLQWIFGIAGCELMS